MSAPGGGEWVEQLMRSFRDQLVGSLYEGVYALDGAPLRRVMDAQAEACVHAFVALPDIPSDYDFEAFLERMKTSGPSRVRIDRVSDDELLWTELHDGECVCPHVRQNVVRLDRSSACAVRRGCACSSSGMRGDAPRWSSSNR